MKNLPLPIPDYEFCEGQEKDGAKVCAYRDVCKRYMQAGYRLNYKPFFRMADDDCKHFESKSS